MILDPGFDLTLRPMKYPVFYDMYKASIRNTWTVEEVNLSTDVTDLGRKMSPKELHLIQRLVAFFATGDTIVANNLVLSLYKHINSPEARMYLSRQLAEEALHIQFYLTLLDTYIPDPEDRNKAFAAVHNIPSIKAKADFCFKWIDSMQNMPPLSTRELRGKFIRNLTAFAACIEGLFFFAAFAYVYFLRSKGLLHGLATGTNYIFKEESCMATGTEVLTPRGWIKFEDLPDDSEVAQFDMETMEVSFVKPLRRIRKTVREDLVVLSNRKGGIHQRMTGDHDVVWKWVFQPKFSKKKASEFNVKGYKHIPVAGHKLSGREHLTTFERFLIALQADGSLPSARYTGERCGTLPVTFSGLKKQRKKDRLEALLKELGFEFVVSEPDYRGAVCYRVSVPKDLPITKSFSDWVKLEDVSSTWANEFLEELAHWDGHRPPKKEFGCFINYCSVVSENIDVVQALGAIGGRAVARSVQVKKGYSIHRCWIHEVATVTTNTILKTFEPYEGEVHCVTVPTGAILVRSNGKVSVTGNCHMDFAFEVLRTAKAEEPELFDAEYERDVREMLEEAIRCEEMFAEDLLGAGIAGMSMTDMREYLRYIADQRLANLGFGPAYGARNPFPFVTLQNVQELTNFFERRPTAYQVGVTGSVRFDATF